MGRGTRIRDPLPIAPAPRDRAPLVPDRELIFTRGDREERIRLVRPGEPYGMDGAPSPHRQNVYEKSWRSLTSGSPYTRPHPAWLHWGMTAQRTWYEDVCRGWVIMTADEDQLPEPARTTVANFILATGTLD